MSFLVPAALLRVSITNQILSDFGYFGGENKTTQLHLRSNKHIVIFLNL